MCLSHSQRDISDKCQQHRKRSAGNVLKRTKCLRVKKSVRIVLICFCSRFISHKFVWKETELFLLYFGFFRLALQYVIALRLFFLEVFVCISSIWNLNRSKKNEGWSCHFKSSGRNLNNLRSVSCIINLVKRYKFFKTSKRNRLNLCNNFLSVSVKIYYLEKQFRFFDLPFIILSQLGRCNVSSL